MALMRMASALARIRPIAFEGIEESGALRLELVVRDDGLRCHAIHAHDVLYMLLSLTVGMRRVVGERLGTRKHSEASGTCSRAPLDPSLFRLLAGLA